MGDSSYLDRMRARQAAPAKGPVGEAPKLKDALQYRCGHHYKAKELLGQDCPGCRRKRKLARIRKKDSKRQKAWTHEAWPLPAGSKKTLTWNGKNVYGELEVPGAPLFTATASGEKACCHALHQQWERWLQREGRR